MAVRELFQTQLEPVTMKDRVVDLNTTALNGWKASPGFRGSNFAGFATPHRRGYCLFETQ